MQIRDGIYLIKPGKVVYDEVSVRYASSSVVLIDDGSLIVVDTGLEEDWGEIERGIRRAGFHPSEVDTIINTHLHVDHIGCNHRFSAECYAHPKEIERVGVSGYLPCPKRISKRVCILETPGHVDGHISVVFEGVVVAGDAIPTKEHYFRRIIPRIHTDAEKAKESMQKIIDVAEIILPGHDGPVWIGRKSKF